MTTFSKTQEDCEQAAAGGNRLKQAIGWPDELCQARPARQVKREAEISTLKAEIAELKKRLAEYCSTCHTRIDMGYCACDEG